MGRNLDGTVTTPIGQLTSLGGLYDLAGIETPQPTTASIALSNNKLENMTDVLRPYFRNRTNSKVAIYIFSAVLREIGRKETGKSRFSHVLHFSAWEHSLHRRETLKCCYKLDDGQVSGGTAPERYYSVKHLAAAFESVHYKCMLNKPGRLLGSYIVPKRINCADFQHRAIQPQVPLPAKRGSIGVCLKIIYGNVDTKLLVDWMEYYKEMKVDTIVTKTYHVSPVVERILSNYVNEGILEVLPFEIPWTVNEKKPPLGIVNERVAILDCHERIHQHTYFSVLDMDEFLFPYRSQDFKDMLANLTNLNPTKSGFLFKSELFVKDWGEAKLSNGSDIVRYFQRLAPRLSRPKYVVITSKIADGILRTHEFNMDLNDRPSIVPSDVAAIKHYRRTCYPNGDCTGKRFNDTSILDVVRRFEDRSSRIVKRLGTP